MRPPPKGGGKFGGEGAGDTGGMQPSAKAEGKPGGRTRVGHSWALAQAREEFEGEGKSEGKGGGKSGATAEGKPRGEGVGTIGRACGAMGGDGLERLVFNRLVAALWAAPARLRLGVRSRLRRDGRCRKVGGVLNRLVAALWAAPARLRLGVRSRLRRDGGRWIGAVGF
jgi:hypothetical protein